MNSSKYKWDQSFTFLMFVKPFIFHIINLLKIKVILLLIKNLHLLFGIKLL